MNTSRNDATPCSKQQNWIEPRRHCALEREIDSWIEKFEEYEEYEVIVAFRKRRSVILKQIIRQEDEKMSFWEWLAPNLKRIGNNMKIWINNLFKKKK